MLHYSNAIIIIMLVYIIYALSWRAYIYHYYNGTIIIIASGAGPVLTYGMYIYIYIYIYTYVSF